MNILSQLVLVLSWKKQLNLLRVATALNFLMSFMVFYFAVRVTRFQQKVTKNMRIISGLVTPDTIQLLLPGSLLLISTTVCASREHLSHPVTAIGGGALFISNIGKTQRFPIQNIQEDEFYRYQTQSTAPSAGFFDLFLGLEEPLFLPKISDNSYLIQYGFNYHQASLLTVQGVFTQGLDEQSANTYHFQYKTVPHQLLIEAKVLYPLKNNLNPYIFAGVGASINSVSQYSTNVPPFITFTRQYQNNMNTSFSYAAGLGVDWEFKPAWRLGLAWRFSDFGAIQLGPSSINAIAVNGVLSLSNVYANELQLQLSKTW